MNNNSLTTFTLTFFYVITFFALAISSFFTSAEMVKFYFNHGYENTSLATDCLFYFVGMMLCATGIYLRTD